MAITDRAQQKRENERVAELIRQGLTTEQIHRRLGVGKRRILRVRAKLKQPSS
jgi:hypothetical protein